MSIEYIQENKNYYEEKINELNDKVKYYQNKTQRQNKEIERLNNIINELDAMFDGDLDGFFTINEKGSCNEIIEVIQNYKDKLKELKGNNND
jgi:chromosome segregation ATPase